MSVSLSIPAKNMYSIPESALRRWARERLRVERGADGAIVYRFMLSGSTCTNVPLNVVMIVLVNAQGIIEAASSHPAEADTGWAAMCGSAAAVGSCDEAIGMTLDEAAFRDWQEERSGCFCSAGNRRHKWRNVFQTLHYALTHIDLSEATTDQPHYHLDP